MNDKTLLAILGSPHQNGPTAAMLSCAVSAALQDGWRVTTVNLYQKNLAFCIGCGRCSALGECVVQDDAAQIAALLKKADRVVLAAPTYWANIPAAVKNLFDRLTGTVMEQTGGLPKPRLSPQQKYLLLTTCATPFPFSLLAGQSVGSLRAMKAFFKYSGMKCLGCVAFAGTQRTPVLPQDIQRKIRRSWVHGR